MVVSKTSMQIGRGEELALDEQHKETRREVARKP